MDIGLKLLSWRAYLLPFFLILPLAVQFGYSIGCLAPHRETEREREREREGGGVGGGGRFNSIRAEIIMQRERETIRLCSAQKCF